MTQELTIRVQERILDSINERLGAVSNLAQDEKRVILVTLLSSVNDIIRELKVIKTNPAHLKKTKTVSSIPKVYEISTTELSGYSDPQQALITRATEIKERIENMIHDCKKTSKLMRMLTVPNIRKVHPIEMMPMPEKEKSLEPLVPPCEVDPLWTSRYAKRRGGVSLIGRINSLDEKRT